MQPLQRIFRYMGMKKILMFFPLMFSLVFGQVCPTPISANVPMTASSAGIMFDVLATSSINVETVTVPLTLGDYNISVFYKSGSYIGADSSDWNLLYSMPLVVFESSTELPLNLFLGDGCTMGLYITSLQPFGGINLRPNPLVGFAEATSQHCTMFSGVSTGLPIFTTIEPVFHQTLITYDICSFGGTPVCSTVSVEEAVSDGEIMKHGDKIRVSSSQPWNLMIADVSGRQIAFMSGIGDGEFDLESYPSGVYSCVLKTDGHSICKKFFK